MTTATRIEVTLLLVAVVVIAGISPRLPDSMEIGTLVAGAALALLLQGGARDVVSLLRERRRQSAGIAPAEPPSEAHCLCLESTVGLAGVLAGVLVTALLADGPRVALPPAFWPVAAALIGLAGLAIRDLVIQWKPTVRILRIRDHGSIIVRFR